MPGTTTLTSTTLASTHQRYGGRSTRGWLIVSANSIMLGLLVRSFTCQLLVPRRSRDIEGDASPMRGRRGRDAGYPTTPAQIAACGFPAPGSSVRLASALPFPGDRYTPSGRLAC